MSNIHTYCDDRHFADIVWLC